MIVEAQEIVRGPYLQQGTNTSIVIRWRTNLPTTSKIWYGCSPEQLTDFKHLDGSRTDHHIHLTGLSAGTGYYYAVGDTNGVLRYDAIGHFKNKHAGPDLNHFFETAPAAGEEEAVSVWVLGDAGTKNDRQRAVRDAFYEYNGSPHVDLILALGDNAYVDGTDQEYQLAWFENMYERTLINTVLWSTVGNHDLHEAESESESGPYYEIFNFPTNGEAGGEPSGTEAYFSFDYANIHFVSVNTEDGDQDPEGPMLKWLEHDLNNNTQDWTVAFMHQYAHYSTEWVRKHLLPVLEAGGVDLILCGHNHIYQRSYLMNGHYGPEGTFNSTTMALDTGNGRPDQDGAYRKPPGRTPNSGTIHLITGSAGKADEIMDHYPFVISQFGSPLLGSVHLSVTGGHMDVKFISDEGLIKDYFTIQKGRGAWPTVNIIQPKDNLFVAEDSLSIVAAASDEDGSITQIAFFANGDLVGVDNAEPFRMDWKPGEGIHSLWAVASDNDGNRSKSPEVSVSVWFRKAEARIAAGTGDAEENKITGTVSLSSSDLELGMDHEPQIVGLRFEDLGIPPKAEIVSANIQFWTDETSNISPCMLSIHGELSPFPDAFMKVHHNIGARLKTKSSISWKLDEWDTRSTSGPAQYSPQLKSVIQEVVNQKGFLTISPIVLLIEGSGKRVAVSFEKDSTESPLLRVIYRLNETGYDCLGKMLNIGYPCDDGDPQTKNDIIRADCSCAGELPDSDKDGVSDLLDRCQDGPEPGTPCDDLNPFTTPDFIREDCSCQGNVLPQSGIVDRAIVHPADDAEEKISTGKVDLKSTDLELGREGSDLQLVGLRFNHLAVPPHAKITRSFIQFSVDETSMSQSVFKICAVAADHSHPFQAETNDISRRARTNSCITWNPGSWLNKGEAGMDQQTEDVSLIIQEIVNRPGWQAGNSMSFILSGTEPRVAESFDGESNKSPRLHIEYQIEKRQ